MVEHIGREACNHQKDLNLILCQLGLYACTPNNIHFAQLSVAIFTRSNLLDISQRALYIVEFQVILIGSCKVDKHLLCTCNRDITKQRRVDSRLNSLDNSVFARSGCHTRNSAVTIAYNFAHIGYIDTNQVRLRKSYLRDTFGRRGDHIVSLIEGLRYRQVRELLRDSVILDNNKGIDKILHLLNTLGCLLKTVLALIKRRCCKDGYHRHSKRVDHLRNDRRCTRSCTATHTGSKYNKVGLMRLDITADYAQSLLSLTTTNFGIITRTLTVAHTYLLRIGQRALIESLAIGVAVDKVYALDTLLIDVVNGVTTCATHTYNHYACSHSVSYGSIISKIAILSHTPSLFTRPHPNW